jgi:PAS domain S-box-containing protein
MIASSGRRTSSQLSDLLHLAVEVGHIGIYETDFRTGRTRFSPELCDILGLPANMEMNRAEAVRLFHPDDQAAVTADADAACEAADGKWNGIYRMVRSDGATRWVSIHGHRYYSDIPGRRRIVRSVGTVIDVTHLKEAEFSLRESEVRLRLALDAARMGTFEADLAASQAVIDAREAQLLGLPADMRIVSADELRTRIPYEDLRASDAKKHRMQTGEEDYQHEFRLSMPDGSARWISAHAAIRSGRIFGVNFDITGRKQAEIALQESEARLRLALAGASLGVFEWNANSDTAIWENDRMYEIFGRTRSEGSLSRSQFVNGYLHPDDDHAFSVALEHALDTNGSMHVKCRIRRKDRSERWIQIDGRCMRDANGKAVRVIGVVADITVRKALQQEASDLSERLINLQEEERQRIAQELHDSTAQHLVAAEINMVNLKSKTRLDDRSAELWDQIEGSIHEAGRELRAFSHLMHPPYLQDDGLHATLSQYIRRYADSTGLQVKFHSTSPIDKLPFPMQRALFRVVQEALANVYRHASASRVSVQLRRVTNRLHLVIADNGQGFGSTPQCEQRPSGHGIGLLGIRARARQFGGDLRIRSGARGTTIHAVVSVPMAPRKPGKVSISAPHLQ